MFKKCLIVVNIFQIYFPCKMHLLNGILYTFEKYRIELHGYFEDENIKI